ncbi:MAG: nicotinate (nicotinamide) nucleotide adenylyltransferase [Myxococcota bacterium]
MNIAILGGSFNPPHVCHVLSATWVLSTRPVDEVWLMPVGQHAFGKGLESFAHRQPMCELAIQPIAGVCRVTDIEHRLGGENRTIDTLQALAQEHPNHRFSLIIGADILQEAHLWKAWDRLERDYGFHVLGREGYPTPKDQDFQIILPEVSSTDIRDKLAEGDIAGCEGRLSRAVLEYILQHRLYNVPDTI